MKRGFKAKTRLRVIFKWITGLIAVVFFWIIIIILWQVIIFYSLMGVYNYHSDWGVRIKSSVIGRIGSEWTVPYMIDALSYMPKETCYVEDSLLRMHRRYPLNEEPHISTIVGKILDPKTKHYNRVQLVSLLEEVTGHKFKYPKYFLSSKGQVKCKYNNEYPWGYRRCDPPKEKIDAGLRDIRNWWNKRKKSERPGSDRRR